jgi:membrane-associated phospholipid phosphatase
MPSRGWRTWGLKPETFAELHAKEYELMRLIQRAPGLLPFSLGVHYSLLPKVITPLLALIVWLSSFRRGASLIVFVCANDCLNTAIKWAVQRPRPRWYCSAEANGLIDSCGAWEVDLSFPSAHTMFFAGLAACAATLYGFPHWLSFIFGASIGISRNYLSMHWPTDTGIGLALGGILGFVWGTVDPYARLLAAGSPVVSLLFASGFTLGLLCLMVATRQMVPPVASAERTAWFANALQSLSPEERAATLASKQKQLKPRNLKAKIPMLVTVWATLALTGLYPACLPGVASLPNGSARARLLQALLGVVGLGGIASLKKAVGRLETATGRKFADGKRGALKALTYVAICAWTFGLSQMADGLLRRLLLA